MVQLGGGRGHQNQNQNQEGESGPPRYRHLCTRDTTGSKDERTHPTNLDTRGSGDGAGSWRDLEEMRFRPSACVPARTAVDSAGFIWEPGARGGARGPIRRQRQHVAPLLPPLIDQIDPTAHVTRTSG